MSNVCNVVRPHHGCHRQEWFLSTPQRGCSSSGLTRTEWTLPGRRSSASPQHETTGPWARCRHDPAGAEPGTTCLGAGERWTEEGGGWEEECEWRENSDNEHEILFVYIWHLMHHHPKHYLCTWLVTPVCHWLISWATTPHQHCRACSWPGKGTGPGRSGRLAHCPPALPVEETHVDFWS